jgi:transposase-like protein
MGGYPPISDDTKAEALNALQAAGGNKREAARQLGIPESTLRNRLKAAIPDGQKLKGTSTLYDKDGNERMFWVKTTADIERQREMLKEAAQALKDSIPRAKPCTAKPKTDDSLAAVYVLTDYHLGQLSWADETGADWNIEIAERMLVDWFSAAIEAAPKAETAVLAQLGDFLHYDSLMALTPTSKHVLDADSRYGLMVRVAIRALRQIIGMLLQKHQHVHIVMAYGNHDLASSVWLREMLFDKYQNEPRVKVDNSATPYYAFEWGKTSLFFHHGHQRKLNELSQTFAALYRDIFGRTKYSYAHMGHLHHIASKEDGLMLVEQHPTLAAKDAHSAFGGYVSNRGACVITYSKDFGEVSRVTIRPEMLA